MKHRISITARMTPLTILIIIMIMPLNAYAPSVGVIPSDVDLGQVSRGSQVTGTLYLSTASANKVTLSPGYITPVSNPWFTQHISEYSEEKFSDWIVFPEDPIFIDGSSSFNVKIGDVSTRANKKLEFIINIPKDAEPGYHVGSISMTPVTSATKAPEVTIFGLARPNFVFRVNGEVKRELQIAKIEAERKSDNIASIRITILNTGTNTVSLDNSKSIAKIYNSDNEIRGELQIGGAVVAPGKTENIEVDWYSKEGIKDGKYKVVAVVNYRSGTAEKTEFVTVNSVIKQTNVQGDVLDVAEEPEDAIPVGRTCTFNWTYIIALALAFAFVAYARNTEGNMKGTAIIFVGAVVVLAVGNYLLCSFGPTGIIILALMLGLGYYIKKG